MTQQKRQVAIIHFNTPELTEAAIWSLRKHGGEDWAVTIFDNSDRRPFRVPKHKAFGDVTIIDNTKGQIIDFDKELEKYPNRDPEQWAVERGCVFGSAKHMMSVQWLMDNALKDADFLLMDSDVLIKKDPSVMFMPQECAVGYIQTWQVAINRGHNDRLCPFLLYINTPMCRKGGARFYDPNRCWGLNGDPTDKRNWYDTGASFLEDIKTKKPDCHGVVLCRDIYTSLFEHYQKGSWQKNSAGEHMEWLKKHADLWQPSPAQLGIKDVAICAIGRNENRYAKAFVQHYLKMGIKCIFLYDNGFADEERLSDVVKDAKVEIIDWRNRRNEQTSAYEDCYSKHGHEYAWIGFFDFDELLNIGKRKSLPKLMEAYADADAVLVNWRIIRDDGSILPPETCVKYNRPEDDHVKALVRGGLHGHIWANNQPHIPTAQPLRCVNPSGVSVKQEPLVNFDFTVMAIDHHTTRTAEEFVQKVKRGFPCGDRYTESYRRNAIDYFFKINERNPEKEAILAQLAW